MLIKKIIKTNCNNILFEIKILLFHSIHYFLSILLRKNPTKLHLGSGGISFAGFANIDVYEKADYRLDLRRNLPFKNESVSFIFSEHTFEHFEYPYEISHLFFECYRILKKRGQLAFSIPDFKKIISSYYSDQKIFDIYMNDFLRRGVNTVWKTKNDFLDLLVRQEGEHKYLYDFETIERIAKTAGFSIVIRRGKNQYDSNERKKFSLYVLCIK